MSTPLQATIESFEDGLSLPDRVLMEGIDELVSRQAWDTLRPLMALHSDSLNRYRYALGLAFYLHRPHIRLKDVCSEMRLSASSAKLYLRAGLITDFLLNAGQSIGMGHTSRIPISIFEKAIRGFMW